MAKLQITWKKSAIGYNKRQKATIQAMGLRHLNQTVVLPDNAATRGMAAFVEHLISVKEVEDGKES